MGEIAAGTRRLVLDGLTDFYRVTAIDNLVPAEAARHRPCPENFCRGLLGASG
jgi:hypothetical protein